MHQHLSWHTYALFLHSDVYFSASFVSVDASPSFLCVFIWKPVRSGFLFFLFFFFFASCLEHCCFWHKANVPELETGQLFYQRFAGLSVLRLLKSRRGAKSSEAVRVTGWVIPPTPLFTHAVPRGGRHPANWCHSSSAKEPLSHRESGAEILDLLLSFIARLSFCFSGLVCDIL